MCSLPTIGDGGDMQRRSRPGFIWYLPVLACVAPVRATVVGTYSDSKMPVSALVLALATVTGLSLPDAGWLPIWESRRRACTSMSPV